MIEIEFIPMGSTGRALTMNSISMSIALLMMSTIRCLGSCYSVWNKEGMQSHSRADEFIGLIRHESACFLSQNMAQKNPEKMKMMPLTVASFVQQTGTVRVAPLR
jgi:hypothetical protein